MLEILALTIALKWWIVLLIITIITFILACIVDTVAGEANMTPGGDAPCFPLCLKLWIFGNLAMWLIYFTII